MLFLQLGFAQEISAKDLFMNAMSFYETGQYDLAIEAFLKAYEMTEKSMILYNISQVYEKMEDYENAMEYLNKYRMTAGEDERDILSQDTIRLKELLEEKKKQIAEQERQEELKRQEEVKKQEELKIQEELKKQEELKRQELEVARTAIQEKNKERRKIQKITGAGIGLSTIVGVVAIYNVSKISADAELQCEPMYNYCFDPENSGNRYSKHKIQKNIFVSMITTACLLSPLPFLYKPLELPEAQQ